MANSLKESKVLLEGWRKFYLKEAEEAAAGGKIVRIFDFDGTLAKFDIPILNNPMYRPLVKEEDFDSVVSKHLKLNEEVLSKLSEGDYVVSLIKSTGFDIGFSDILDYAKKQDPLFKEFVKFLGKGVEYEQALGGGEEELKRFIENNTRIKDVMVEKSFENLEPLKQKIALYKNSIETGVKHKGFQPAFAANIQKHERKLAELEAAKQSFEQGQKISTEGLVAAQKKLIESKLKGKVPSEHIFVKSNLAEYVEKAGSDRLEAIKGTSGKRPIAEKIAKENPGAAFEVYDNQEQSLNDVTVGLLNVLGGGEQDEAAAEEDIPENATPNEVERRLNSIIARIEKGTKTAETLSKHDVKRYLVSSAGTIKDVSETGLQTGKQVSPEDRARRETTGPQRTFMILKKTLFELTYNNLVTRFSRGRTSNVLKEAFKKACDAFFAEGKHPAIKELIYAMVFSKTESPNKNTTEAIRLKDEVYNNEKAIRGFALALKAFLGDLPQLSEEMKKALEKETETTNPKKKAKTKPVASTGKPEDEPVTDEPEDDEYDDYVGDQDFDESLHETILKELRPMLAQLSKISNAKLK